MAYKLDIKDSQFIVITFNGESDLAENLKAREEVVKVNAERGLYHIISDWREAAISKSVSEKEFLTFGKTWPKTTDGKSFMVATILSKFNNAPYHGVDFSSSVGKNNGIVSKPFWEIAEAIEWLKRVENPNTIASR